MSDEKSEAFAADSQITKDNYEENLSDETTAVSEETEITAATTGSWETIEDETEISPSISNESIHTKTEIQLSPGAILALSGRHIKAEDTEWARYPVPSLTDIIIESAVDCKISDVEKYFEKATEKQRHRILELLSLDLPLKDTLALIEDEIYWERMCLSRSWRPYDVWRYSESWKFMYIQRSVQEHIQNFIPNTDDITDLCENLKIFTSHVTSLKIQKLERVRNDKISIDLSSEEFDDHLDEIITTPTGPVYLDFERIFECLKNLKNLTILLKPKYIDREEFHFNNADFNRLLKALRKLKVLTRIQISNRNLSNEQLTVVLRTFSSHEHLTELNLSYNFIDDHTCDYVSKLLISDCPLRSLILKYNKITDEGAKSISAALSVNTKLGKLDLSLNMIGNEGGRFLAKMLISNYSVTELDVSKNKITSEGGIYFAELIQKSESIRNLKIQENFLGEDVGEMFYKAIKDNEKILVLDVHFCGFRNQDEGSIHQNVLRNRRKVSYKEVMKHKEEDVPGAEFLF